MEKVIDAVFLPTILKSSTCIANRNSVLNPATYCDDSILLLLESAIARLCSKVEILCSRFLGAIIFSDAVLFGSLFTSYAYFIVYNINLMDKQKNIITAAHELYYHRIIIASRASNAFYL